MIAVVLPFIADRVDDAVLNFNESSLLLLNVLIGLMRFGMALGINTEDFKAITRTPYGPRVKTRLSM